MEISVVLENTSSNDMVKGIHGLSLLIESNNRQILYDFGPKGKLYSNADKLGIDLSTVSLAVLSHNHMDHGGDLNHFLQSNQNAYVHTNSDLSGKLYSDLFLGIKIPVGISIDRKYINRLVVHNKTEEISSGISLVQLSDYSNKSTINNKLFVKTNNAFYHDTFNHESALAIIEKSEIVVLCSCSHHGVLQILKDVEKQFPNNRIRAFVGGFHMYNPISKANELSSLIEETAKQLMKYNFDYYTGHCTGDYAYQIIYNNLGERLHKLSTGMKVVIK